MEKQKINFKKEREFGEIINATISFIGENYKLLLKALFLYVGPFAVFIGLFTGLMQKSMFDFRGNQDVGQMGNFFLYIFFILILGAIAYSLLIGVTYEYIKLYINSEEKEIALEEVWQNTRAGFWNVLGTLLLVGIIFFGVYIVSALVVGMLAIISPFLIVFIFVPITWVAVSLSLVFIIRGYENADIGAALSRSFYLVKNNWWWTFLLLFVTGICVGIVRLIFNLPYIVNYFSNMVSLSSSSGLQQDQNLFVIILPIISSLASYILSAIIFIVMAFQYFSLVEKKDKTQLSLKVDDLLPNPKEDEQTE